MRRFLLRPVWLAILICVLVPTAALAAERAEPITVRAVFEGQLRLPECGLTRIGLQTVPATGRGALSRASKRTGRGWKRRAAMGTRGPRLRVYWRGWP